MHRRVDLSRMMLFKRLRAERPLFLNALPSHANRDGVADGDELSEIPPYDKFLSCCEMVSTKVWLLAVNVAMLSGNWKAVNNASGARTTGLSM